MKTRRHRPLRKHTQKTTGRWHALAERIKARIPLPVSAPPAQEKKVSSLPEAVELVCANTQVCDDGLNLIRSTVSDEEGSYLVVSIEVPVPFTVAYDAWTRFDDIPHFMRGRQLPESRDGSRMTWRIRTLFDQFAWQAKVCDQVAFDHIAWKSVEGTPHPGFGSVSFEPISHSRTWIMVQVAFDMSGVYHWLGDPLPSLSHALEQSLKRFHGSMAAVQAADAVEAHPPGLANAAA